MIRRKLAQCTGSTADAIAIAAATVAIWPQIAARLAPVIGARGADALFNRALHLTSLSFPWLAVAADRGRGTALLDGIRARLRRQEAAAATAASQEFLYTFTELLADMIGDSLTDRLLGPVWDLPASAFKRETST
jgi:hypothetical protein